MKRLLIIAALAAATTASAKVELDLRGDHTSSTTTQVPATGNTGSSAFGTTRARVNFSGALAEGMTIATQVDLVNISTASPATGAVNYGTVTQKMGSGAVTMGKMGKVYMGGAESLYGSNSTDSYFISATHKDSTYRPSGVSYMHNLSDSSWVNIGLYNNDYSATASSNGMAYGLAYSGKFGSTQVVASYNAVPDDASGATTATSTAVTDTYMSLGVNYDPGSSWMLGFTYNSNVNAAAGISAAGVDLTATSMVLNFKYVMGQWAFPIKFESSSGSLGSSTASLGGAGQGYTKQAADSLSQYSLAAEYSPTGAYNKDLRYHVAYVSKAYTYEANTGFSGVTPTNPATTMVVAGFRWIGDIGK
jgi:hypothetical protein